MNRFVPTLWPVCIALLIVYCTGVRAQIPAAELAGNTFSRPADFDESPVNMGHFNPARQASLLTRGPESNDCIVQVRDLEQTLGKAVGTSPWHTVSARRYSDPNTVTLWGTTLTDSYRFLVDGERFEALDRFPINYLPTSITWNMLQFDDGRFIVPDPNGYSIAGRGRRTSDPTLLVLHDDPEATGSTAGPIRRVGSLGLTEDLIRAAVAVPAAATYNRPISGNSLVPTFSGEIVTTVSFSLGEQRLSYLLILDHQLARIVTGTPVGDGLQSNEIAAEELSGQATAFYVPLGEDLVKLIYDPTTGRVEKQWRAELPVRRRTGSTPTLVNTSDGGKYVVLVDSKCAVTSIINGLITCSEDTRPSQLVAVERTAGAGETPRILTTKLPEWLQTVENSPAALGDHIVVCNYSGYLPNGLLVPPGGQQPSGNLATWGVSPDAVADFATGLVVLKYDTVRDCFGIAWEEPGRQVSGIPTISGGSNMVYGTGAERQDGSYYLYGFRLTADSQGPAGELRLRVPLGKAPFRNTRRDLRGNLIIPRSQYDFAEGELFDAGNQLILLEDRSVVVSGGRSLVRVIPR